MKIVQLLINSEFLGAYKEERNENFYRIKSILKTYAIFMNMF